MPNSNPNLDRWVALTGISLLILVLSGYTLSVKAELPTGLKVNWNLAPSQNHQTK